MAAPYTATSDLANLVTTAYDQKIRLALRNVPMFRSLCDTKPVDQTHPGSSVVFNIHADLAPATTPLNEVTDPSGVSLSDTSQVTVTLQEYGNYSVITKRLEEFAYDNALDSNIANILAYNQADSVDTLVRTVMDGSTNVIREIGGTLTPSDGVVTGVTATDTFKSKHIRYAVAKLRGGSVVPWRGDLFAAYIHPDVAHDLRAESGTLGWRVPHEYASNDAIWAAEVGTYEGAFFVESPRCKVDADAGATTTDVYHTYIVGKEAIAEAVAEEFHTVIDGVVVDPLKRKSTIGWFGIAGWSLFRSPSLTVVKTASSIGSN